jgi:hypothetical protein
MTASDERTRKDSTAGGTRDLRARLRGLPLFEPNPLWRERTKQRLMRLAADERLNWFSVTRWAVYATQTEETMPAFAANVRAAGSDWRPVVVEPRRLGSTVRTLQPSAVVIDASVPHVPSLVADVRSSSTVEPLVLHPSELPQLKRKIA